MIIVRIGASTHDWTMVATTNLSLESLGACFQLFSQRKGLHRPAWRPHQPESIVSSSPRAKAASFANLEQPNSAGRALIQDESNKLFGIENSRVFWRMNDKQSKSAAKPQSYDRLRGTTHPALLILWISETFEIWDERSELHRSEISDAFALGEVPLGTVH